jgi:hypothetical protein
MSFNESLTVTLKGPDDWDAWEKQFNYAQTFFDYSEGIKE